MTANEIAPVELGRVRRFLLRIKADVHGPDWLRDRIVGEHPQREFFEKVARDICSQPESWQYSACGLTNQQDQIGIWARDGVERVVVAADADKQFSPPAYWRWFFYQLWRIHMDYTDARLADRIGVRL